MPLSFNITNTQFVEGVTVSPTALDGSPSSIEAGSLQVAIIDGNPNAGFTIAQDGSINFLSGGGPTGIGTTVFSVSGDSDLGEGVTLIADTVTLNVAAALAANMGLGGGTIKEKQD